MKKGECSRLQIAPKYAFGSAGKSGWNVPPNTNVLYDVTLKEFESVKEAYELKTPEEKLKQANFMKEKGTTYFKKNNIDLAIHFYEKAIRFLQGNEDDHHPESAERTNVLLSTHLNLALCLLKTDQWGRCMEECEHALKLDAKNEKALFRMAQAEFARQNYEEARRLFLQVAEVNPDNKAAQQQATLCQHKVKTVLQQEKDMYRNIFAKLAKPEKAHENNPQEDVNGTPASNGEHVPEGDAHMETEATSA